MWDSGRAGGDKPKTIWQRDERIGGVAKKTDSGSRRNVLSAPGDRAVVRKALNQKTPLPDRLY